LVPREERDRHGSPSSCVNTSEIEVTVLIPAFNEEGALASTVEAIRAATGSVKALEIIVINDGSDDRTGEIARALPVTLIEHETRRGYGASLKDGLRQAKGDLVLIADADGTYHLEAIRRLAAEMAGFDMISGDLPVE